MAKDPGMGYKVQATIIDMKNVCTAGHEVGDSFPISCQDTNGLCGFFLYSIFADLQTFQFGGKLPWWQGDSIEVRCPDPNVDVIMRLERTPRD
jgi:uncharacterized repeat protein (TIGR04076 family)